MGVGGLGEVEIAPYRGRLVSRRTGRSRHCGRYRQGQGWRGDLLDQPIARAVISEIALSLMMRSASATCFSPRAYARSWSRGDPSTTQINLQMEFAAGRRSVARSADRAEVSRPEVSIITRTKLGTAPRARSAGKVLVSCRSLRSCGKAALPVIRSHRCSTATARDRCRSPPYSLTTTAVPAPSGVSSNARIRVVLPEPRKPVTATTGSRAPRARR